MGLDGRGRGVGDDLFFRLAVARIELPPHRHRTGDIEYLARHFWRELGGEGEPASEPLRRKRRAWCEHSSHLVSSR
jgi:DNA-binding NtrC family response regulator